MEQPKEETMDQVLNKRQKERKRKIILMIIIIVLLFLFWLLGYRMGKIGYQIEEVIANPDGSKDNTVTAIKVMQGDIEITKNTLLNIFNNEKYDGEKIIAPKSSGIYQFCISNETKNDLKYHIKFFEETKHFVNIKYKLKIDNIYIRGNEENYIGIEELDIENITVLKGSNNIFTLEWYWEDNDELDTMVGKQEETQCYTLKLEIDSEELHIRKWGKRCYILMKQYKLEKEK